MATDDRSSGFRSVIDDLRDRAGVETVFGDPVEREGRTVVPVASVAYGFGGGFGSGGEEPGALEGEEGDYSEGAGGGGGVVARPVGALEVTDDGTRFVTFRDRRRGIGALLAGLGLGYLVGRLAARRKRDRTDG